MFMYYKLLIFLEIIKVINLFQQILINLS